MMPAPWSCNTNNMATQGLLLHCSPSKGSHEGVPEAGLQLCGPIVLLKGGVAKH